MFIVLAILAFGIIIAIHELGHYIAAKLLGVKVNEFAIGMGPKLLKKQGKETLYSLRALPFGGFCAMEGEHEEGEEPDPRSFLSQKRWRRIVILVAGSFANILAAFIIILAMNIGAQGFVGTTLTEVTNNFPDETTVNLMPGDRIVAINGERLFYAEDFSLFMQLHADNDITFTIDRNGERIEVSDAAQQFRRISTTFRQVIDHLPDEGPSELMAGDRIIAVNGEPVFDHSDYARLMEENAGNPIFFTLDRNGQLIEYESLPYIVDGQEQFRYGIIFQPFISVSFNTIEPTVIETLKYSFYQTYNFMRMIRLSLSMMISGTASVRDIAGPVGIVSAMNTIGQETQAAHSTLAAIRNIVFFTALIGVNVAVINLLPIPALDGGRILFTFITWVIEKTTRKKLDPKYEGYINTGVFFLLIGLMVIVFYNDIMRIIGG